MRVPYKLDLLAPGVYYVLPPLGEECRYLLHQCIKKTPNEQTWVLQRCFHKEGEFEFTFTRGWEDSNNIALDIPTSSATLEDLI